MKTNIQEIKDLSIGFKSQKGKQISILRNITTNIRKGETVGIVGESGSGKSTLALAMMGYATLAGMIAQGVLGTKLYNGQYRYKDTHELIGNITTASYFTGAGLSLFAPPPLISNKNKGLTSIKAHKWLATVHFSAMIATNLLAESEKKYHRTAAFTLFGSYALAVVSFKF